MDRLLPMEVAIAVEVHVNESELEDLSAGGLWLALTLPGETLYYMFIFARFITKLVEIMINKAVVGSGHRDTPKYVGGGGVASHSTPIKLGVPLLWCSCLCMAILGNFVMGALWTWLVRSASSYLLMLHH